jgi:hypothetical protein
MGQDDIKETLVDALGGPADALSRPADPPPSWQ